jgi:type IV fimbrial biogenesis protein FimT
MKHYSGFTLIELATTLCITTILITVGVPSLDALSQQMRSDSGIRRIQQTLQLARNAAINYGQTITVCPLNNGRCDANWQNGIFVFTDNGERNKIDGNDRIIYTTDSFDAKDIVQYNKTSVRFLPDGMAYGTNGTLKYCPREINSPYSRAVVINMAGRIRFSTAQRIFCAD